MNRGVKKMKIQQYVDVGKDTTTVRRYSQSVPLKKGMYQMWCDVNDVDWLDGGEYTVNINFISNNNYFSSFTITTSGLLYGIQQVSDGETWVNMNYRFIEIYDNEQSVDVDTFMKMVNQNIAIEYVLPTRYVIFDPKLPLGKINELLISLNGFSLLTHSYDSEGLDAGWVAASDCNLFTESFTLGAITYDGTYWRYGGKEQRAGNGSSYINSAKVEGLTTTPMIGYYYYILQDHISFMYGDEGGACGWIADKDMQLTAGKDTTWTGVLSVGDKSTDARELYTKIGSGLDAEEILRKLGENAVSVVKSALDIPNDEYLKYFVKVVDVGDLYNVNRLPKIYYYNNPDAICLLCLQSDGTYKALQRNSEGEYVADSASSVVVVFVDTAKQ